jgi:hypothetical protein
MANTGQMAADSRHRFDHVHFLSGNAVDPADLTINTKSTPLIHSSTVPSFHLFICSFQAVFLQICRMFTILHS